MLYINDIFYSIQGESSYAGYPCLFIRFSGCNLRCLYCDTKEALIMKENFVEMSVKDIIEKLYTTAKDIKLVEITGGEPLIQDGVYDLFDKLIKLKYTVLLETNGTIFLKDVPADIIKVVDVKCPSSGYDTSYNNYPNIEYIYENDEVKFVIGTNDDYEFAKEFLKKSKLKTKKIIFSPISEKISPKKLADKIMKDQLNVRLGVQLHKILKFK